MATPSLKSLVGTPRGSTPPSAAGAAASGAGAGLPSLSSLLGGNSSLPSLGDLLKTPKAPAASGSHGHGSVLGGIEAAAHWTAGKAELAGHDLKTIPGGLVQVAKVPVDEAKATYDLATGNVKGASRASGAAHSESTQIVKGTVAASKQAVEHPLRDPFLTITQLLPALKGVGSAGLRVGAAADAARAGEGVSSVAKAVVSKPEIKPRLIRQGDAQVSLHPSRNEGVRLVQHLYDKVIQHALDTNPEGRVGAHAAKRVGGTIAETERRHVAMQETPVGQLAQGAAKLGPRKLSPRRIVSQQVPRKVQEAALRLTSENNTAEEAAAAHRDWATQGRAAAAKAAAGEKLTKDEEGFAGSVKQNLKQAALYDRVAKHELLTQDEHGDVTVNAEQHPHLAAVDAQVAAGQAQVDEIARAHDLMTEEDLARRRNGPARIRAGATYETPTPGKLGLETPGLKQARQRVTSLQGRIDRATHADEVARDEGLKSGLELKGPMRFHARNPQQMQQLRGALAIAQDDRLRNERSAANRVKPTGIVGGAGAREGRGYVTYRTEEPRAPKGRVAAAASPVVNAAKSFIPRKPFTGEGLQHGKVPDNTTRLVAQHMRDAYRYVNTDRFRRTVLETGSPIRRTSRDVLVRDPDVETAGKISPELDQLIGRKHSTIDELPPEQMDAVKTGFDAWHQHLVPGLRNNFADDRAAGIGTKAPDGYKWVDRNVLGDLGKPGPGPRGAFARNVDKINTAVTAATVYFKLGHFGTRYFTNAATNIIQGSATPLQIGKSVDLWKVLTPEERAKALAAAGQHSFHALPLSDETGAISKGISAAGRVGAQWWAKHADSVFRFNSLAYEARKAGFDTPEKFRDLLAKLENPEGLNAAQTAKVDWVGKRANREAIAYDRLSHFERTYITRAFWFYPWTAAATRFAVNTALEHPYKTAALGNLGVQGRKTQQLELGDLPSYEQGLVKLAGGNNPLVTDLSTFSPLATPGDLLQVPSVGSASSYLNPAYAALAQLAFRQNQYGQHSNHPLGDALSSLFSPTPEAQILNAYLKAPKPTQMFRKTPASMFARALVGPGLPRKLNVTAAHSAAARERAGR